jgi:hypothetical protein
MKKYILLISLISAAVFGATLQELVEQAEAEGYTNYVDIRDYLNAPQGYDTNTVTNVVDKSSTQQAVEQSILQELLVVGVSTSTAVASGWEYIITALDDAYDAAPAAGQPDVLRSSLLVLAGYEQLKTLVPDGPTITPGFGKSTITNIYNVRTPNQSLAMENLGHQVSRDEVKNAE